MDFDTRTLALISQRLDEAERNIQYVRQVLDGSEAGSVGGTHAGEAMESLNEDLEVGERIVEGVFDGQNMQADDGSPYPVPPNYASKSKLVEGDILKLTIGADGSFKYKQIRPVERRRVVGKLSVDEKGNFVVVAEDKRYQVLLASVTFYRAEEGDEVTVLVPINGEAEWGAVENVIHR